MVKAEWQAQGQPGISRPGSRVSSSGPGAQVVHSGDGDRSSRWGFVAVGQSSLSARLPTCAWKGQSPAHPPPPLAVSTQIHPTHRSRRGFWGLSGTRFDQQGKSGAGRPRHADCPLDCTGGRVNCYPVASGMRGDDGKELSSQTLPLPDDGKLRPSDSRQFSLARLKTAFSRQPPNQQFRDLP